MWRWIAQRRIARFVLVEIQHDSPSPRLWHLRSHALVTGYLGGGDNNFVEVFGVMSRPSRNSFAHGDSSKGNMRHLPHLETMFKCYRPTSIPACQASTVRKMQLIVLPPIPTPNLTHQQGLCRHCKCRTTDTVRCQSRIVLPEAPIPNDVGVSSWAILQRRER